jgi:hypothetical protein
MNPKTLPLSHQGYPHYTCTGCNKSPCSILWNSCRNMFWKCLKVFRNVSEKFPKRGVNLAFFNHWTNFHVSTSCRTVCDEITRNWCSDGEKTVSSDTRQKTKKLDFKINFMNEFKISNHWNWQRNWEEKRQKQMSFVSVHKSLINLTKCGEHTRRTCFLLKWYTGRLFVGMKDQKNFHVGLKDRHQNAENQEKDRLIQIMHSSIGNHNAHASKSCIHQPAATTPVHPTHAFINWHPQHPLIRSSIDIHNTHASNSSVHQLTSTTPVHLTHAFINW